MTSEIKIKGIKLASAGEENSFSKYIIISDIKQDEPQDKVLDLLSRINIFVGANNSGKSRFMRLLSRIPKYEIQIGGANGENLIKEVQNTLIQDCFNPLNELYKQFSIQMVITNNNPRYELRSSTFSNFLQTYAPNYLSFQEHNYGEMQNIFKSFLDPSKFQINFTSHTSEGELKNRLRPIFQRALTILNQAPSLSNEPPPQQIYIPVLRGLRHLDPEYTDFYERRIKNDYFPKVGDPCPQIFTGLGFYQGLMNFLLGNNKQRQIIVEYQKFISANLFEGKEITLTPNINHEDKEKRVVYVKIGQEIELPIYELGDGIQSAILLTFWPFIQQKQNQPTFFFIEEPEMFLHPGLQRKILEFYASPACSLHHFFLTTHSNHLLDLTLDIADISVFNFRKHLPEEGEDEKTATFEIEAVNRGHQSSLELLGVRNSSVFLVNATIWVEGITDRWYLRKMLELYITFLREEKSPHYYSLKEDVHYSFVEYGGANITHWSFLDNEPHPIEVDTLCAKAMVIADNDGVKAKEKRKEQLKEKLQERFIVLPCREVENLLPYEVICGVVAEYENIDLEQLLNSKTVSYSQYKDTQLAKFIEAKILKNNFQRQGGYADDYKALKNKVDFCKKALTKLTSFSELPATTQEVIKKIYNFIVDQNKR